jgi:hypothetical protein
MSVRSIGTSTTPVIPQYGRLLVAGTLTTASQFLSAADIPQTYRHLRVIIRNAKSASSNLSYIQGFANASYNNFLVQTLTLDANSYYPSYTPWWYISTGIQSLKNNTWVPSAAYEITILNYSSTTQTKQGHWIGGGQSATDRVQLTTGAFDLNITAPITSFGFYASNSWAPGSTLEVYGEGAL